ncbi:MAG: hypothetical protein V1847_00195 [Candidatus Diapherotrites archaeon]
MAVFRKPKPVVPQKPTAHQKESLHEFQSNVLPTERSTVMTKEEARLTEQLLKKARQEKKGFFAKLMSGFFEK